MSFWDDPASWPASAWPSQPGGTVTGTVTKMAVRQSRYARLTLCVELDGDGKERWCPTGLWRELGAARVEPGDNIRVTRLEDSNGSAARWTVDKNAAPSRPSEPRTAPNTATGPSW